MSLFKVKINGKWHLALTPLQCIIAIIIIYTAGWICVRL